LFPIIVDSATLGQVDRLRQLFVQGTLISLVTVIPIATGLSVLAEPLVKALVGPDFAGSVPIIYILSLVVSIRVGNSTATTLLKGAGHHRLLATSNLIVAFANLAISVALVRRMGLIGVALGTLIAVAIGSVFVLFPAACRGVGLNKREAVQTAIVPALWPAIVMALFLAITRNLASVNLASIGVQAILAGLIYLTVFLTLAIGREQRKWYFSKARQLLKRPSTAAAA
jgi:O-antigen/teichoic acid export membrane protein